MTLRTYAAPLWDLPVEEVDTAAVLSVLQPLWQTKRETASRLRGRIEAALDAARANPEKPTQPGGTGTLMRSWRRNKSCISTSRLSYANVPEFIGRLRSRGSTAALALEFAILTAARSGEALGARWDEIDLEGKAWVISAARMKAAREHRVPLSTRAVEILDALAVVKEGEFVFLGHRRGRPLSDRSMRAVMHRMKIDGVTVHGMRSAFRDWCGDQTNFPREIAEAALAHSVGSDVERAYRRSDALEKRRALMQSWADYCNGRRGDNVVHLTRQAA